MSRRSRQGGCVSSASPALPAQPAGFYEKGAISEHLPSSPEQAHSTYRRGINSENLISQTGLMTGVMTWRVPTKGRKTGRCRRPKKLPLSNFGLLVDICGFVLTAVGDALRLDRVADSPRTHGLSGRTDLFPGLVWLGHSPAGAFDRYIEDQGGDGGSNTRAMVT